MPGPYWTFKTRLVEVKAKTLRYLHTMRNSETGEDVATMELLVAYIDTAARKAVALPEAVQAKAQAWLSKSETPTQG